MNRLVRVDSETKKFGGKKGIAPSCLEKGPKNIDYDLWRTVDISLAFTTPELNEVGPVTTVDITATVTDSGGALGDDTVVFFTLENVDIPASPSLSADSATVSSGTATITLTVPGSIVAGQSCIVKATIGPKIEPITATVLG